MSLKINLGSTEKFLLGGFRLKTSFFSESFIPELISSNPALDPVYQFLLAGLD